MADITYPTAIATTRVTAFLTALDAGTGAAKAKFYTGIPPTDAGAITTQNLLGTCTCSDPAGTVTGRVLTFSAITDDSAADADGTVGFVRFTDSADTAIIDMTAGISGSGKPVIMNTLSVLTGGPISILSATITEPGTS